MVLRRRPLGKQWAKVYKSRDACSLIFVTHMAVLTAKFFELLARIKILKTFKVSGHVLDLRRKKSTLYLEYFGNTLLNLHNYG